MIDSIFISNILKSIIEGETDSDLLKSQLNHLTIEKINYTGNGVFVEFSKDSSIGKYRLTQDCILNGLEIKSQEFDLIAEAILFIREGLIDYLEIWSKSGIYPNHELKNYELLQTWK